MAQAARPESGQSTSQAGQLLLAADIGGTYARIGLVDTASQTPVVVRYRKYACADYPDLATILGTFLNDADKVSMSRGAIACAGYVLEDKVINTNLPWQVSLSEVRRTVGLEDLMLVNDFTAIAHATRYVGARDVMPIALAERPLDGPVLIVGPGTGLGAAVRIPGQRHPFVLSTEAGQSAITASTEFETQIVRRLLREQAHIPTEHVLSGPGLSNLYRTIGAERGQPLRTASPTEITAAAVAGNDALAEETLRVFCGWLGSTIGNLVLLYGAQGGVYLAGGILPQISEFLLRSDFVERFRDKGAMRPMLERVPVNLIEHGQLGVLGAADWYLHQSRAP